jgi:hypothetical protein
MLWIFNSCSELIIFIFKVQNNSFCHTKVFGYQECLFEWNVLMNEISITNIEHNC